MEEETPEIKPERKGIRSEFLIALSAIAVSLLTLSVYVYQADIMRRQQHTSVWPYVEWTMSFSTIDGIYLTVKNKGVGPALIKSTDLRLDGKPVASARELMNLLTHGKADSIWSFTMGVNKRVVAPGEEIRLFHMKDASLNSMDFGNLGERISYSICYCSIYGDCWTTTGLSVTEGGCE